MAIYKEVTEMPHCGTCGKLLAPGVTTFVADRRNKRLIFCSEKCITVFDTYKEPKYGDDAVWAESIVG